MEVEVGVGVGVGVEEGKDWRQKKDLWTWKGKDAILYLCYLIRKVFCLSQTVKMITNSRESKAPCVSLLEGTGIIFSRR